MWSMQIDPHALLVAERVITSLPDFDATYCTANDPMFEPEAGEMLFPSDELRDHPLALATEMDNVPPDPCCNEAGEAIGVITSGSPSPTLGKNIALAYVPPAYSAVGTVLYIEIRSQKCKAQVVPTPFYKRTKKAAVPQVS